MAHQDRTKEQGSTILSAALRACRAHIGFLILFSAALNLLYLAPSLYMLQVYDRVLTSGGLLTLVYLSGVLLASLAVLAFLDGVRMRLLAVMAKRFDRLVAPHVLMAALQREGRAAAGQAHALREFDTLRAALTGPPALAAVDAPWAPLFILVCFLIHPWIGLLALIGGVALVLVAFVNQLAMHRSMRANDQTTGAMYAIQSADSGQGDVARALGMQHALVRRQLQARESMSRALNETGNNSAAFSASTKFLRLVLQSAALGLGAYLALQQQISAGGVIAASILCSRAFAPLELVVGAWRQFEQGRLAYAVLRQVLKTQEDSRTFTALPAPRGVVALDHVGVRSPGGERVLLNGVNLRLEPGEIVGVVGPSGAGKTTLMRAIAGASAVDAGAVRIDGAKLTDWPADELGRHIGYLPQEVALFSGAIGDNIARFEPRTADTAAAIDAGVVAAAMAAGAHEMILSLPRGYDTEIGPNGRGLSAGQAQRIGLARALYREPPLLVLDEPNAHLDSDGETALIETLRAARDRGATIIVVAHRAGFLNIADKLLVIKDGRVDAFGPREQVMAKLSPAAGPRPVVVNTTNTPGQRP